jgi:hypothetical protein
LCTLYTAVHKNAHNWLYFSGEHSSPWPLVYVTYNILKSYYLCDNYLIILNVLIMSFLCNHIFLTLHPKYNTSSGVVNVVAGHVVVLMKKLKIWKVYTIQKNGQTDAGQFSIRNNTVFCSSSTDTICWLIGQDHIKIKMKVLWNLYGYHSSTPECP